MSCKDERLRAAGARHFRERGIKIGKAKHMQGALPGHHINSRQAALPHGLPENGTPAFLVGYGKYAPTLGRHCSGKIVLCALVPAKAM
jgi:hypothetical protein